MAVIGCLGLVLLTAAPSPAAGPVCDGSVRAAEPRPGGAPLALGIYPGGGVGTVTASGPARPEDPAERMAALTRLRGDGRRPFVLHLYASFRGDPERDAAAVDAAAELTHFTRAGFPVELVLRYRPIGLDAAQAVPRFAEFVRLVLRRHGQDAGLAFVQIGNEANVAGAPDAADGAYPGAVDALVQGVLAAHDETAGLGRERIQIGFNWSNQPNPSVGADFWNELARRGGAAFARAVDWVGFDAYPATWAPVTAPGGVLAQVRTDLIRAMTMLRRCYLPLAGISARTPLHVAENGWPTGPGRSEATQAAVLRTAVQTVSDYRRTYNVSDYRWFDLRDSDSQSANFETHYGLLRDDYTAKPAFDVFRRLVGAACATSRTLRMGLPRARGGRLHSLSVRVGGRVVRRARGGPVPRQLVLHGLPAGRARVVVRIRARAASRGLTRVSRSFPSCRAV